MTFLASDSRTVRSFGRPVRATQFAWRQGTVHELTPADGGHDGEVVYLHDAPSAEAIPTDQWRLLVELVEQARVRCLVAVPGLAHERDRAGATDAVVRFVADLVAAQGQHRVVVLTASSSVDAAGLPLTAHLVPQHPYGRTLADRWEARCARRALISRLRSPAAAGS